MNKLISFVVVLALAVSAGACAPRAAEPPPEDSPLVNGYHVDVRVAGTGVLELNGTESSISSATFQLRRAIEVPMIIGVVTEQTTYNNCSNPGTCADSNLTALTQMVGQKVTVIATTTSFRNPSTPDTTPTTYAKSIIFAKP